MPLVIIRGVEELHRAELIAANQRSWEMHEGWVNPPKDSAVFDAYLQKCARDDCHGFVILDADSGRIAGAANISHVVLGVLRCAFLGYYGITGFDKRGYMMAGLVQVITWAFDELKLNRLEANVQPENLASKKLLARLGFRLEGFSPRYLQIGGQWRDHERYAILADEWQNRPAHLRTSSSAAL